MSLTTRQINTLRALTLARQEWLTGPELVEVASLTFADTGLAGAHMTAASLVRRELVAKAKIRGHVNYRITAHGRATLHAIGYAA